MLQETLTSFIVSDAYH